VTRATTGSQERAGAPSSAGPQHRLGHLSGGDEYTIGTVVQGGSTITQQLRLQTAEDAAAQAAATADTVRRKLREAQIALAVEQRYGIEHRATTSDPYTSGVYTDQGEPHTGENAGNCPRTLTMDGALYRWSNTYFAHLEDERGSVAGPGRAALDLGMHFDRPNQTPAEQIVAENNGAFTLDP
jgi:hypothetical protein